MKLTATVAILLSASFGAADVGGLIGYEHIECESSDASPYMHHIAQLVENLRAEDDSNLCFNEMLGMRSNRCGCTMKKYTGKDGGAVFSLCSGDMDEWDELVHRDYHCQEMPPGPIECNWCEGMKPDEVADKLEALAEECNNPHRAGGIFHTRYGGQIRLYSAPA